MLLLTARVTFVLDTTRDIRASLFHSATGKFSGNGAANSSSSKPAAPAKPRIKTAQTPAYSAIAPAAVG
jgi:hypothetical protein